MIFKFFFVILLQIGYQLFHPGLHEFVSISKPMLYVLYGYSMCPSLLLIFFFLSIFEVVVMVVGGCGGSGEWLVLYARGMSGY
jgi:hypothetical protein